VLTSGGGVKCWGQNAYGQLGSGSASDSSTPVDVSGLDRGVEAVAVGYYHSCALTNEGRVMCWGHNYAGGLGNGSATDSHVPVELVFATPGLPQTNATNPRAHEVQAEPPLLPLLVGLVAGIAMLVRRRAYWEGT
jgi:alpha-tubulin suppressor-like RCC1 family protein